MQKVTLHAFKMSDSRGENNRGRRGEEREERGFTVFSATTQRWMRVCIRGR